MTLNIITKKMRLAPNRVGKHTTLANVTAALIRHIKPLPRPDILRAIGLLTLQQLVKRTEAYIKNVLCAMLNWKETRRANSVMILNITTKKKQPAQRLVGKHMTLANARVVVIPPITKSLHSVTSILKLGPTTKLITGTRRRADTTLFRTRENIRLIQTGYALNAHT